jgi:hypothetical protein
MKEDMRKAVFRIISDKYRKKVSEKGLSQEERENFLAKLNSFLSG